MRFRYLLKEAFNTIVGIGIALVVGVCIFLYITNLQEHGCVIGTTCISLTR